MTLTHRGQEQSLVVTYRVTPGGPVSDATGVSLTLLREGVVVYGPFTAPNVVRDDTGRYRFEWLIPDDAPLGVYTARWAGTLPGDDSPSLGYETFTVAAAATVSPVPEAPSSCWPVDTSCIDGWDDPYDPDNDSGYSEVVKAAALALAGQTMRMLTGYRVGGCPVTVRPVGRGCTEGTWPARAYGGNRITACRCASSHEVRLPQPAGEVISVTLDGFELTPTAYRLDTGGRLVRTDGLGWPAHNGLHLPEGPGVWSVTYVPGYPVDLLGAQAAGRLAAEYVKACSGGKCDLPQAVVTGISRNGVSMTLTPGAFPEGKTGVRTVDAYLERWNPHALTVPPMAWSPDVDQPRVIGTSPGGLPVRPGVILDGGDSDGVSD